MPESLQNARPDNALALTLELIDDFLAALARQGKTSSTLETYKYDLKHLYQILPDDKCISDGTLREIKANMLANGLALRSVNRFSSCVNSLLQWSGRPDLKDITHMLPKREDDVQPELTRQEYLRLLSAAKHLGKEKAYLLTKVFALTGLNIEDLPLLTVENIRSGQVETKWRIIKIPPSLRPELISFARKEGITEGPVFITRNDRDLGRSAVNRMLKVLCNTARVMPEKVNPMCLQRLYQTTMNGIRDTYEPMVERSYELMLEKEQRLAGWDAS